MFLGGSFSRANYVGNKSPERQFSSAAISRRILSGGNYLWGNYPGAIIQGAIFLGGNCPGGINLGGNHPRSSGPGDNFPILAPILVF